LFVALVAVVEFAIDARFCGSCLREFREFRDVRGAARDVVARMREAKRARESFIINCIYLSDRLKIVMNDLNARMYRKMRCSSKRNDLSTQVGKVETVVGRDREEV
jgi:hypothetical protein